ncbi:MAG: type II toxin-antitoxin system RelE/ParE family toxin [Hyphomonadaceae bacterium]|nr:MAG: plasmid stabilization system [Caulobacteraceae bacterium]MBT9444693.1 type II toxin-antitoxin system RelE/ParE family toxin [Hyphomonadaceae bacterium]TPW08027.1 MAG: plasmid stabilization system [Alphaproteobacteria bacterium]
MAEFRLRPEADDDLASIWRWTLDRWSRNQADDYHDTLTAAMALLAEEPHRGQSAADIDEGLMRRTCNAHVIFYRLANHGIDVVRVLHAKMNWATHLKDDE